MPFNADAATATTIAAANAREMRSERVTRQAERTDRRRALLGGERKKLGQDVRSE